MVALALQEAQLHLVVALALLVEQVVMELLFVVEAVVVVQVVVIMVETVAPEL